MDLDAFAIDCAEHLPRGAPDLRPRSPEVLAFAQRAAEELGEDDGHVPADLLAEGLRLLPPGEGRRLARTFAAAYPEGWHRLLGDSRGQRKRLERAFAAGALKVAICERRPRPRSLIAQLEPHDAPPVDGAAVALVLEPAYVWSAAEVFEAAGDAPHPDADDAAWIAAAENVAVDRVHVERVRFLGRPLRRQLPVRSLTRASRLLTADLDLVDEDDDVARRAAALLLLGIAASLPRIEAVVSPN
jgi:hypothetical protein